MNPPDRDFFSVGFPQIPKARLRVGESAAGLTSAPPCSSGRVPGLFPGAVSLLPDDGQLCFQHLVAGTLARQGLPGEFPLTLPSPHLGTKQLPNSDTQCVPFVPSPPSGTPKPVPGSHKSNS